jgi:subtilase family serine protease
VTFNWRPGIAGTFNTVVIADSRSVITESDEENNELTAPVIVSLAGPSLAAATAPEIS